jgi:hypothetical protein
MANVSACTDLDLSRLEVWKENFVYNFASICCFVFILYLSSFDEKPLACERLGIVS